MTTIKAGRSGVHIFTEATELSFLQNIQTSYSIHPASNPKKTRAFPLAVK